MKLYDASLIIIITLILFSAAFTAVSYHFLGSNSPITKEGEAVTEAEVEALIFKETGVTVKPQVQDATNQK